MGFTRRSTLMRIMAIEQKVHGINSDIKYKELQNNLKILETNVFGSRHIRIGNPENLERMIELRRYSEEMDDVIQRYKKGLEIYEDRIEILNMEKKLLQKELFPIK
ncbi:hypothetical protein ACFL0D_07580 [Thermoproteota archaeon]